MKAISLCAGFLLGALPLFPSAFATTQSPDSVPTAASAPLSMEGWTLEERLALGLYQVHLGHLVEGHTTLLDPKDAAQTGPAFERLQRACARAQQLIDSRDQLIRWAIDNKKKLRWPLTDTMVVIKPLEWKDGVLSVGRSSKHDLNELRAEDMSLAFLAANFQKKSDTFGADWLESYCLGLIGDAGWESALPKDFSEQDPFVADVKQAQDSIPAGPCVAALEAGVSSPNTQDVDFESLADILRKTPFLEHRKPLLHELARRHYSNQCQEQGLAATTHAKIEKLDKGRVRLTYPFNDDQELADFQNDDRWWVEERASYDVQPEETKAPWTNEGYLWLKGKHNLTHVLEFEGDMSFEMKAQQDYDVDASEFQMGTIIVAINAALPFHYARSHFNQLLAIENPQSQPRIQTSADKDQSFRIDQAMQTKLWTTKGKAFMSFNGAKPAEVEFKPTRPGTVLIWVHSVDAMYLSEIVIEGVPTPASQAALADAWLAGKLKTLGLLGSDGE